MFKKMMKMLRSDEKSQDNLSLNLNEFKRDLEKLQLIISSAASSAAKNAEKLKSNSEKINLAVVEVNQSTGLTRDFKNQFEEVVSLTNSSFEESKSTLNSCNNGQMVTDKNNVQVKELKKNMDETVHRINSLVENLKGIVEISKTIQNVAFQTKLLAFNASVEAARAGEHGKGFSVVAQEIQKLGENTNQETKVILELLNKINSDLEPSKKSLSNCKELVESTTQISNEVNLIFKQIAEQVEKTSKNIETISKLNNNQRHQVGSAYDKMVATEEYINEIKKNTDDLERRNKDLSLDTENAFDIFGNYDVGSFFNLTLNRSFDLQNFFEKVLLKHIDKGNITLENVLYGDYIEVTQNNLNYTDHLFDASNLTSRSFNPPKFIREYEPLVDLELIAFTDQILLLDERYKFILYTDYNAKSITHNMIYVKKWSENYELDLAQNRIKRFFDSSDVLLRGSRFGLNNYQNLPLKADRETLEKICGKENQISRKKYLVQTYLRDTGEVMTVMSMPLYLNNNYVGAIFIGWSES